MSSMKRRISVPNKIALSLVAIATFALVGFTAVVNNNNAAEENELAANAQLVRDGSHRLSTAESEKAVLVEFLDFECEACRAAYPLVEQLREDYGDQVTFVSRYFPLPGHPNSTTAALAVEAAAQQGEFEAMYHRMFKTQEQWSHSQDSQADTFRGYAEDLGLDMNAYDRAIENPATKARVMLDKSDGVGLGVSGTPTFFLDGEKIQPSSGEEFRSLIEESIQQ